MWVCDGYTEVKEMRKHGIVSRRTKIEVLLDILRSSITRHKPTQILFDSNVSWKTLSKYLSKLTENGYIIETDSRTRRTKTKRSVYHITDKGLKLLHDSDSVMRELEELI